MSGQMIIVAAPSGAGKSTFLKEILSERDDLASTVTYTTRSMRAGESEGHPYHFVSLERFLELREAGFFVEWAEVHGRFYGTPQHQIDDIWRSGKHVIMDIDVQGAATFRRKYPSCRTVFILPPSISELKRRIIRRDGGEPRDLDLRMKNAEAEVARAGEFEFKLVNDDFSNSYAQFKKIVEECLGAR